MRSRRSRRGLRQQKASQHRHCPRRRGSPTTARRRARGTVPPAIPVPPCGSLLRAPGLPRSCPIIAPCPVGLPAPCWGQAPRAVPGGPQSHRFPQPAAQNPNVHNPEAVALLLEQGGRRDAAVCPPSCTSWYFSRQGMKALTLPARFVEACWAAGGICTKPSCPASVQKLCPLYSLPFGFS